MNHICSFHTSLYLAQCWTLWASLQIWCINNLTYIHTVRTLHLVAAAASMNWFTYSQTQANYSIRMYQKHSQAATIYMTHCNKQVSGTLGDIYIYMLNRHTSVETWRWYSITGEPMSASRVSRRRTASLALLKNGCTTWTDSWEDREIASPSGQDTAK